MKRSLPYLRRQVFRLGYRRKVRTLDLARKAREARGSQTVRVILLVGVPLVVSRVGLEPGATPDALDLREAVLLEGDDDLLDLGVDDALHLFFAALFAAFFLSASTRFSSHFFV